MRQTIMTQREPSFAFFKCVFLIEPNSRGLPLKSKLKGTRLDSSARVPSKMGSILSMILSFALLLIQSKSDELDLPDLNLSRIVEVISSSSNNNNNNNNNNTSCTDTRESRRRLAGRCNYFRGKWVYDSSYPLYDYRTCPFIDPQFDCQKYGRPDSAYLKYRWQPYSCSLPKFNGVSFLERWRGKKIMFVGDSLSLNMWESLSCMIHAWVPNARHSLIRGDGLASLTFLDYGVSLMLFRTQFLVDLVNKKGGRVLKLDSINQGNAWKGMDMLIFNSWHWWTHTGRTQPWDYMEDGNKYYKDMNRLVAYYKAMTTWARWVNRNIDPSKTKVFFQGISPTHYEGKDWGMPTKSCQGETQPYFGVRRYPAGTPMAWVVMNKVLSRIKKPVYLLDITGLSQYRKDAHPSSYSGEHRGTTDCSHWCLPGLPDTWNELLYAALFS